MRVIEEKFPTGRHDDWIWPLSYIPRSWTAFHGKPPKRTCGTTPLTEYVFKGIVYNSPQPIPPKGYWHFILWPFYFAKTTKSGWHIRFIARWDDNDGFYECPSFTIKKLK